jgi:hypothetical protein
MYYYSIYVIFSIAGYNYYVSISSLIDFDLKHINTNTLPCSPRDRLCGYEGAINRSNGKY